MKVPKTSLRDVSQGGRGCHEDSSDKNRRTDISSNTSKPPANHARLKQRISRLNHLRRTRVARHRRDQQQRLHEATPVVAQDAPRQRHVVRSAGVPFRECGLRVRFADVVEYVAAAAGAEVAAVARAVALDAEDVGGGVAGWVGDVAGEEWGRECLWEWRGIVERG